MKKFLYYFGFCSPEQWINNDRYGWDDEDSIAFFIRAPDRESAMEWGREVAEAYVHDLFSTSELWTEEVPSWRASNFANGLEEEPFLRFEESSLRNVQVVELNEMPDFGQWNTPPENSDRP